MYVVSTVYLDILIFTPLSMDINVYVDPKATLFLIGTQMDYEEGELESGFKFLNPNEKGRCGCGESFHV